VDRSFFWKEVFSDKRCLFVTIEVSFGRREVSCDQKGLLGQYKSFWEERSVLVGKRSFWQETVLFDKRGLFWQSRSFLTIQVSFGRRDFSFHKRSLWGQLKSLLRIEVYFSSRQVFLEGDSSFLTQEISFDHRSLFLAIVVSLGRRRVSFGRMKVSFGRKEVSFGT